MKLITVGFGVYKVELKLGRREEKPTRCHCMLLWTLLYPSSGVLDYRYAIAAHGVQCCKGEKI